MNEKRIEELEQILENERKTKEELTKELCDVAEILNKISRKKYICRTISVIAICITLFGMFVVGEIFYNKDFIEAQETHNEIYQNGYINTINKNYNNNIKNESGEK